MEIRNWYILNGAFWCDIRDTGYFTFHMCKIVKYNSKTNEIKIINGNHTEMTFILDFKKMDSYFITTNKIGKFKEYLANYE